MSQKPRFTPSFLYRLGIGYVIFLVLVGFWLVEPIVLLVCVPLFYFGVCGFKATTSSSIAPNFGWFICIPFIVCFWAIWFGMDMFDNYAASKTELKQITAILPNHESHQTISRSNSITYLGIGEDRFHCQTNSHDSCPLAYPYAGKTATIYYQPDTMNDNLIYEMQVDDKKVYEFEQQKADYSQESLTHRWYGLWILLLLVIPSVWFARWHNKVQAFLPVTKSKDSRPTSDPIHDRS